MIAQAYNDGTMRVFDRKGIMLCEIEIRPALKDVADRQLKRLRIKRRGAWIDFSWGSEAKLRFVPNHGVKRND